MEDRYLGNGVYASFDGKVWLDCRGQDKLSTAPSGYPGIAIDGVVLGALNDYVDAIRSAKSTDLLRCAICASVQSNRKESE